MKCPKCDYLGYETGTRCRHCGYDFSLLDSAAVSPGLPLPAADLPLRPSASEPPAAPAWLAQLSLDGAAPAAPEPGAVRPAEPQMPRVAAAAVASATPAREPGVPLPLFSPGVLDDDAPLIKMPAAPRAPLSVRRTPDRPRLRTVARTAAARVDPEPALFPEDPVAPEPETAAPAAAPASLAEAPRVVRERTAAAVVSQGEPVGAAPRLLAAVIDHALLLTVDAAVLYFTLRIASLSPGEWALLPPVPMVFFLGLLKIGYFAAFTAIGGQTIGKMATGLTVVGDGGQLLDPGCAVKRALAGAASILTAGLGFLPAVLAADRRALHDRLAGTRVVRIA